MTGTATDTFGVFGTTGVIVSTEPAALGQARAIADAELSAVDLACSRFRPDSELSRLNRARGEPTRISELFMALITAALRAAELTGGTLIRPAGAHWSRLAMTATWPISARGRRRPLSRPVRCPRCPAGALSGSILAGQWCS